MLNIITNISAIFIYILIGFVANKTKVLPDEANDHIIKLLLNITAPCLVISSIVTKNLNEDTVTETIQVLALSMSFFIVAAMLSLLLVKPFKSNKDKGVLMVIITSINTGFMGFPIVKAVFSNDVFYLVVIANIMMTLYVFSICILQVNYGDEKRLSIKSIFKPLVNVLTISTVISVIMLFSHIKLPSYPLEIVTTLGDITIPLSMIVVGIQLGGSNFKSIVKNHRLIYASICNVLLVPAITLLIMYFTPFSDNLKLAIVASSIFPCAVLPVALAYREGKNATLLAEGVALTTLFSMITIPMWLLVLIKIFV